MTAAATESVRHSRAIETGGFGCRFLFGVFSAKWKGREKLAWLKRPTFLSVTLLLLGPERARDGSVPRPT
jgi:hypothetical protein